MVVGSIPTPSGLVSALDCLRFFCYTFVSCELNTENGSTFKAPIFYRGFFFFLTAVFLSTASLYSQTGRREHFLSAGPGSAGTALGDSLIAKGVDASAGFYNPATLVGQPSGALFEYASPNINATRNWLAMAAGDRRLKGALLWKHESMPLNSSRNGMLLSAGISEKLLPWMPQGTSLGLTLGYVQQKIADFSASSVLANLGFAWNKVGRSYHYGAGMTVNNVYFSGFQFREGGEKEVWPQELNLGGFLSRWGVTVLGSANVSNKVSPAIGVQYAPFQFLELRLGYNSHPRMGVGLEVKRFRLDYAMQMGQIQNAQSISFSYLWGKELPEKDYTDPLNELQARYSALGEFMLTEIQQKVRRQEIPELGEVLKLLAVDLKSEDGWSFYESFTGEKRMKLRMPYWKKARRLYLEFAVAYANNAYNARDLGQEFLRRYPNESVNKLIRVILEKDLNR